MAEGGSEWRGLGEAISAKRVGGVICCPDVLHEEDSAAGVADVHSVSGVSMVYGCWVCTLRGCTS